MGLFFNEEIKELRESNEHLRMEIDKLLEDQTSGEGREANLNSMLQKAQLEVRKSEKETADLRVRLGIIEDMRTEAQRTAASAAYEQQSIHHQQLAEMEEKSADLVREHDKLKKNVTEMKKGFERTSGEAFQYKTQISQILVQSEETFKCKFTCVDELMTFLVSKPLIDAQKETQVVAIRRNEEKLRARVARQKTMIGELKAEAERLNAHVADMEEVFRTKHAVQAKAIETAEREVAKMQKSGDRRMLRIRNELETVKRDGRPRPRMFIYREPAINIAPKKTEVRDSVINKLEHKLANTKSLMKTVMHENGKQRDENGRLRMRIVKLEALVADLRLQKETVDMSMDEMNAQVRFLQHQRSEERDMAGKLRKTRNKLITERQTVDNLRRNVSDLRVRLSGTGSHVNDSTGRVPCSSAHLRT